MKRLSGAVVFVCAVGIIAVLASFPPHASSATVVTRCRATRGAVTSDGYAFTMAHSPICGSASVQVNSDNSLSGYAWSNEAGWISFNSTDTASCGSAAAYNPSTGALSGWARAVDGVDSDGCISLSGTAKTRRRMVSFCDRPRAGYAWASDVFGWISFWGSNYGVTLAPIDVCSDIPGTQSSCRPTGCQPLAQVPACASRGNALLNGQCVVNSLLPLSAL